MADLPTLEEKTGAPKRPQQSRHLHINVEAYGGGYIPSIIREMADLATRMQVDVWADLNGVRTLCRPGDDPKDTYRDWEKEIRRDGPYRYASA